MGCSRDHAPLAWLEFVINDDTQRRRRVELRRETWAGEIVSAGTPKPALWAEMTVDERLTVMTRLCRSQWTASGREIRRLALSEWPGEVFEVAHGRDRTAG